mgnify:CR=1 FL=1
MLGDLFVKALIVQYGLAMCAYLMQGQPIKALYWLGALMISVSVLTMKG